MFTIEKPDSIDGVPIQRFSMKMTGKKLREKLGYKPTLYPYTWELPKKFRSVPKKNRLRYLIKAMRRHEGINLTHAELSVARAQFNSLKNKISPIDAKTVCYCCDHKAKHRHHVTPLFRGGRNRRNNIVPLCKECHTIMHPHMLQ